MSQTTWVGTCPICERKVFVGKDGTVMPHKASNGPLLVRNCPGSRQPWVSKSDA